MDHSIADIRTNYTQKNFLETDAAADAIEQFRVWWDEAVHSQISEINAMTLATANAEGIPDARIVLLKDFSNQGFVFFTNYNSQKGQELAENGHACLVFFWKELERQVRISGKVVKISQAESEEYFYSRPIESQIGATASPQSAVIPNRAFLDVQLKMMTEKANRTGKVEKPETWGGYLVQPMSIEFWQGRASRLHDRIRYKKGKNNWLIERLAP